MHSNSDNIDIMVYDKADELLSNVLNDIKFVWKKDSGFIFVLKVSQNKSESWWIILRFS